MKSFEPQNINEHYSPLASTEERSIHDNINLNRQSLEKGLRNRPNQYVLVDRGILRNPGKAFSDKMSQLDLAKKRDKLRIKIANRPEREELVRKLILQEQSDNRQNKFDKIKEILDDSINNRPGSLELVGKNILQVDRLLASRLQSGEITYPKVCGVESNFSDSVSSNHSTPLPSISEIDITNTLNELSDLQTLASSLSTKSNSNRNIQYSYKKTCRVGRYSFHNIEFRPAAQKAREYQQNQLVQFEEIQAQRNPNLKRIHSELTTKSHNSESNTLDSNTIVTKHSLLHRLNVHELKSECKIRMIPCSNIPKVQLVEKLLPYESEILASHTSFDSSNCASSLSNRRSMPVIQSIRDISPPETNCTSNLSNSLCNSLQSNLSNNVFKSQNGSKLSHSHSEPLIQHFIHSSQPTSTFLNVTSFFPASSSVQNSNFNFFNFEDRNGLNYQDSFDQFTSNNSYSSVNYQPNFQSTGETFSLTPNDLIHNSNIYNNRNENGYNNIHKNPLHMQVPISQLHSLHNNHKMESKITFLPSNVTHFNTENVLLEHDASPLMTFDCGNKFDVINREIIRINNFFNVIKWILPREKQQNIGQFIDQFKMMKNNLIKLINEMIVFINEEIKLNIIDNSSAYNQRNWLNNLLISVENNLKFHNNECVKMELNYSKTNIPTNDMIDNCEDVGYVSQDIQVNNSNKSNLDSSHTISNQRQDDHFFLESFDIDDKEEIDHFDLNELTIPETPLTDFGNSPLYNDDLDEFMYDLLNV